MQKHSLHGPGKRLRWSRFIDAQSGHALIVPIDHGLTSGPIPGLGNVQQIASWVHAQAVTGIIAHKGIVERFAALETARGPGVMLHLNGMATFAQRPDTKEALTSIETALRLGVDAVSLQVNFTEDNTAHNVRLLGATVDAASAWGLPVLVMIYDRKPGTADEPLKRMRHMIRTAYELGVDAVKVDAPPELEQIPALLEDIAEDVAVFFAGGPLADLEKLAAIGKTAVRHGAAGMCVGRNVFQRPDPVKALAFLRRALAPDPSIGVTRNIPLKEDTMPEVIEVPRERYVIGIRTQTKNASEGDPKTARIAGLWQRFYRENLAEKIPRKVSQSPVCAVYTDYESDQDGEYCLTVGCEVSNLTDIPEGMVGVAIPAGKYAQFPVVSSEPKSIQEGWRQVWSHFSRGSADGARAYHVDFEEFRFGADGSPGRATIHISVRS